MINDLLTAAPNGIVPVINAHAANQPANFVVYANGNGGWPTYYGQSSDPTYSVSCSWGACSVANYPGHAPAGALVQGNNPLPDGGDRHLTFIDQTTGMEYDLWHVATSPLPSGGGTIQTDWSGYTMAMVGGGQAWDAGEGDAARVGNLAGRIRIEELEAALLPDAGADPYIHHALSVVVNCINGVVVYPAQLTPSNSSSGRSCYDLVDAGAMTLSAAENAPPMGARLYLNMTFSQIDRLSPSVPQWKLVILRTLATYGAIINDTGSSFYFDWQTESGEQYTSMGVADPWLAFAEAMAAAGNQDWHPVNVLPDGGYEHYTGTWFDNDDGLDGGWTADVWDNLVILNECVSNGLCNP